MEDSTFKDLEASIQYDQSPKLIDSIKSKIAENSKFAKILSVVGLIALFGITVAVSRFNQNTGDLQASFTGVDLYLSPAELSLNSGETTTWNVLINTNQNLVNGVQLELNYDPTLFDYVGIVAGNTLSEVLSSNSKTVGKVNLDLGVNPLLSGSIYSLTPYSGTGILAKLTLRAKTGLAPTTTSIGIARDRGDSTGTIALTRASNTANAIGDLTGSNVVIGLVSSPTPTSSPSMTPSPTPVASPTPSPSIVASPSPIPSPTPTPTPSRDVVTIQSARVVDTFLRRNLTKVEVVANSTHQPNATLTVQGYGEMKFESRNSRYIKTFWITGTLPSSVTVTSSNGGSASYILNGAN